ncbi:MAG: argininosuccinate lyase [Oscillospiraceae bacterium]|nr:argininosuccinate lyase [Oscillospiraceae bacterium]
MKVLWSGRAGRGLDPALESFNSSLPFDSRMYEQDIKGSLAHAAMLRGQGLIDEKDFEAISGGLNSILDDIKSGALEFSKSAEDIHSFIETELTERVGDAGKRLHTARSRNDQTALDLRLYLLERSREIKAALAELASAIMEKARLHKDTIMPGYTHLQRGQPLSFAQHILAYAFMLERDRQRLDDCDRRTAVSPLGSCALAGTTLPIDRFMTAKELGMRPCENSVDGVSDRDFAIEFCSCAALAMVHLSRLAEELILWSSLEFGFIEPDESCSTGSSIMPQKKNPDIAELARGKSGRVFGDLMALLTVMKGLPLAYDKDMQEDKEAVFDAADTALACLRALALMVSTMKVKTERMLEAAKRGFINATDCADYLAARGMPFRDAYKLTGELVRECAESGRSLDELSLEELKARSQLFEEDYYRAIDLRECMRKRSSYGGTSPASVEAQLEILSKSALFAGEDFQDAPEDSPL